VAKSRATVRSFQRAARNIAKAARSTHGSFGTHLRWIAEEIMTDVKDARPGHGVPVDEGTLRDTGRVDGPSGGKNPQVSLSFGGAAAKYALIQHEVLTYHHKIGEARYLVRGLERWRPSTSKAMDLMKKETQAHLNQESKS
jgi:hypothetical protein